MVFFTFLEMDPEQFSVSRDPHTLDAGATIAVLSQIHISKPSRKLGASGKVGLSK